jgi:hypothetical protein
VLLWFVHMSSFGKKSWKLVDRLVGIATLDHMFICMLPLSIYIHIYILKKFLLFLSDLLPNLAISFFLWMISNPPTSQKWENKKEHPGHNVCGHHKSR